MNLEAIRNFSDKELEKLLDDGKVLTALSRSDELTDIYLAALEEQRRRLLAKLCEDHPELFEVEAQT
jgi:hypothetical protein